MSEKELKLGNTVRDIVTGLQGIAVSKTDYLDGTTEVGIQPVCGKSDDKLPPISHISITQIEKVDEGIHVKAYPSKIGFEFLGETSA